MVARPSSSGRSTKRRRSSRKRARRSSTGWARRRVRRSAPRWRWRSQSARSSIPRVDGASGLAYQELGASTATLGDVRDRAELVVIWRADPVVTHPRLFERLRLPAAGRELVVVDERRTATAAQADAFVKLPADRDVEALST